MLQQKFISQLKRIVEDINSNQPGSTEVVLGYRTPEGHIENISELRFYEKGCGDLVWEVCPPPPPRALALWCISCASGRHQAA